MLRVLSQRAMQQVGALRRLLLGPALSATLPAGVRCTGGAALCPRWVSTSVAARAVEPRKPSAEEETQLAPPQSQAGTDPQYAADPGQAHGAALENPPEADPLQDKSIGLFQRFKKTFKQYGKVMIPVHLVTSSVWFGTFYYSAMKGVNVVPFLEFIGLPESLVGLLKDSQSGYALTAYAMYKIATPARYTVTLGGTSFTVKYLRKHGYLSTPPPVKEYFQDKMEETRERLTEKMEETKERFSEKMEETRELLSGRMEETKERLSERMEETKDKITEKLQETKDKVSFRKKAE
ncbi:uncharacterized protein C18orf19 homolog B [Megalops cyprinoides]|uniref:uncharacterized protein C18orf19 homolog B n=1 Tax=Megalops cyprinoides TaxID=118141 RepID=UPI0018643300|nr:uncharacterized protein C18orf19 homolog B [Megalops cyprinoides]XP_036395789.1 uncharacterized protein C18orf19 homolog B [Megalops cyprinoides]XP_036395790.1 uncharacterized protein C18orf19 homolog B [Megalops cyprinoides]